MDRRVTAGRGELAGRLDEVSAECRGVVEAASVVGEEPGMDLLQRLSALARDRLLELLEEAVAAGILVRRDVGRYGFADEAARAAVYDSLGVLPRIRLHQRAGEALEASPAPDPDLLARHFLAAAAGGQAAKAYRYCRAAGDRAMAVLAYQRAARRYADALAALDLEPNAGDRIDVLLALGGARDAAGELADARESYLAAARWAREASRPSEFAEAALGLAGGRGFEVSLLDHVQIELLEEALARLGDADDALRAWVMARLSVALSYADVGARRGQLAEEAVALARGCGDPVALAYALCAYCDVVAGPAEAGRRLAAAGEVVGIAVRQGDRQLELLGRRLRLVALLETGDLATADAELAAYAQTAATLRQPVYSWYVPLWRGMRALLSGRLAECDRQLAEVRRLGELAHSENALLLAATQRVFRLLAEGRGEDGLAELDQVGSGVRDQGVMFDMTYALALAGAGRLAEAAQLLDRLAGQVPAAPLDSEWLPLLTQLAEVAAMTGGHPVAEWAYGQLLPYRERYVVEGIGAVFRGSVERYLCLLAAVLGREDAAAEHAERAREAHRRIGADWLDREPPAPRAGNVFRREGEVWAVSFAGRRISLTHAKGLADLGRLLAAPGRDVPAVELASSDVAGRGVAEPGLGPQGDLGELADAQARAAYRSRLRDLELEIEEAEGFGDPVRASRAREERDQLAAHLATLYGLGGRARRAGDPAERARTAVTARIRATVRRIEAVHPELGRHLRHSIRTGTLCGYHPEQPIRWET